MFFFIIFNTFAEVSRISTATICIDLREQLTINYDLFIPVCPCLYYSTLFVMEVQIVLVQLLDTH